ncbi:hypothetical protein AA3990_1497 [Gluconobacter roseus NBRC 3990]|nr:hypothetical protein AA3990_1497 [Gluconobacter roseus NBRC 3990]
MRWKFDGTVQAEEIRIFVSECLPHDEKRVQSVPVLEHPAPSHEGGRCVRNGPWSIDHENGTSIEMDIARIFQIAGKTVHEGFVILGAVILRDEEIIIRTIPAAAPVLVCPHETERKIDLRIGQKDFQWLIQQAFAVEPKAITVDFIG